VEELDRKLERDQLPGGLVQARTADGRRGSLKFSFQGRRMEGIACDLRSPGLQVLEQAIANVRGAGEVRQFSMTGSLPLVRDLQRRGFDVQITGFGRSTYYHAPNEQAHLEHFRQGFAVLEQVLALL
jgi:acetylornithine deacetylase/succinyl-diaminopimelate desuccinylase-like protein